jgi:hypothetical protein
MRGPHRRNKLEVMFGFKLGCREHQFACLGRAVPE